MRALITWAGSVRDRRPPRESQESQESTGGNRVQSQQSSLRVTAEPREARCWGAGVRLGRERDGVSRDPIF